MAATEPPQERAASAALPERTPRRAAPCGANEARALLAAALALPRIGLAQVDPPEAPSVQLQWLHYQDRQPGLRRIEVASPALRWQGPVGEAGSLQLGWLQDAVSGASPRWHSALSGASRMSERRRGADIQYGQHGRDGRGWRLGAAGSRENDHRSQSLQGGLSVSSEDRNWSFSLDASLQRERIGSVDDPALDGRRRSREWVLGVVWAAGPRDLWMASLGEQRSRGFHDDPYKRPDLRPEQRRQAHLTLRWHHHFGPRPWVLRSHYRGYGDSWGVRAHSLVLEPLWRATPQLTLGPYLRWHSQRAARFYFDPPYSALYGEPFPIGYQPGQREPLSADARLAGFGARSLGWQVEWESGPGWRWDLSVQHYRQRAGWRIGGPGSPGLAPLSAQIVRLGLTRRL